MRKCIGCRRDILLRYVTCGSCWLRLPLDMRERFNMHRAERRGAVLIEMVHWFRDNPDTRW
jgi:hypothetical protein